MSAAERVRDRIVTAVNADRLGAYGVHVLLGADDVAEHRWRSDDRVNLYSVSKGVSALAAGIAVDEGLLTLDTRVPELLGDLELGAGVEGVTLRHLLTMSSGIDFEWFGDQPVPGADLAQAMLGRPSREPGGVFQYSDASTYVAMRMLGAAVGDVRDWLLPRLFAPLGIDNPQWHRCPLGSIVAGSGLELRTEELARIGRVLRDGGLGHERRIVSASWIDGMHSNWTETGAPAPFARYAIAGWEERDTIWRLDGRYGQYVVVDSERDAVVTITAHEETDDHRLVDAALSALDAELGTAV